jgi:hypothetical protein
LLFELQSVGSRQRIRIVRRPKSFSWSVVRARGLRSVTRQSAEDSVIGQSSSECILSQVLLWLCDGDSSRTQEGECPPVEAGSRGLVRDSRPRELSVCSKLSTARNTGCV